MQRAAASAAGGCGGCSTSERPSGAGDFRWHEGRAHARAAASERRAFS